MSPHGPEVLRNTLVTGTLIYFKDPGVFVHSGPGGQCFWHGLCGFNGEDEIPQGRSPAAAVTGWLPGGTAGPYWFSV